MSEKHAGKTGRESTFNIMLHTNKNFNYKSINEPLISCKGENQTDIAFNRSNSYSMLGEKGTQRWLSKVSHEHEADGGETDSNYEI